MDTTLLSQKIKAREFHLERYEDIQAIQLEEVIGCVARTGLFDEHPVMLRHEEAGRNNYARNMNNLLSGLDEGQSIHVRHMERILDNRHPLVRLFFQIQEENAYVADSISCFISPPGGKALSIHHDETDIFTLQLRGNKKWELFERVVSQVPATYMASEVKKQQEFVASAGDFFYLPKGTIHNVCSLDNTSVSIAFIYKPLTYKTVVMELVSQFMDLHSLGAENLPLDLNPDELNIVLEKLRKYTSAIDQQDVEVLMHNLLAARRLKLSDSAKLMEKLK